MLFGDLRQLEKQIKRAKTQVEKLLKELNKERFNSPELARYKLKSVNKKLKLFEIK